MTIPQPLLNAARTYTDGEIAPSKHAASRHRFIDSLDAPRSASRFFSFAPLALGVVVVVGVLLGANLALRHQAPLERREITTAPIHDDSTKIPDADKVIAGLRPRFRQCFEDALKSRDDVSGKIVIGITVDGSGHVTDAKIVSNEGLPDSVGECMIAVVRTAEFTGTGHSATLSIPISFVMKH